MEELKLELKEQLIATQQNQINNFQQVIKARIVTPTVAAMLARVEEDIWHEQA